jgi:hypothetical protein
MPRHADKIIWLDEPEEHDYPAAQSYLTLLYKKPATVKRYIARLRRAAVTEFKAKDIARASGLSLLGISNFHVRRDKDKIREGKALSPLLLLRVGKKKGKKTTVIADGYHRLCAAHSVEEDVIVRCKIV